MPMPTPNKDESQNDFMGRCMRFMTEENNKKPDNQKREQKQMVAMCFSQFGRKDSKMAEEDAKIELASADFVEKFLAKYPQYAQYFE